jgi:hypothetical protein
MVSVLFSSVVDRGFEARSSQTKDFKISICCFSAMYAALRWKIKDWLARNKDNVSEWGDMSIRGLLFHAVMLRLSIKKRVFTFWFNTRENALILPL